MNANKSLKNLLESYESGEIDESDYRLMRAKLIDSFVLEKSLDEIPNQLSINNTSKKVAHKHRYLVTTIAVLIVALFLVYNEFVAEKSLVAEKSEAIPALSLDK